MNFLGKHYFLVGILLLTALLRLIPIFNYQFTYDELSGLERTQFNNWHDLIHKGVKVDAHPALVQVIIFSLVKLFGYKTWVVKLPFVLISLGSIIYAYFLGLKNFSAHAGRLMALFLAFSLVFVYHAAIARMYVSGVLFSLALLYYFFNIAIHKQNSKSNYFLLGLFCLLSAYNHHINALFALSLFAGGFFLLDKNQLKAFLTTAFIVTLVYLPNLPVTLYQLSLGGIGREQGGWLQKPEWHEFVGFIKLICGTHWNAALLGTLVISSVLMRLLKNEFRLRKIHLFLAVLFLVNYLTVYLYSILKAPIYQHSVMLFCGTALLLLFTSLAGTSNLKWQWAMQLLVAASLVYTTYFKKDYYRQCLSTVFEYQFERTMHYKNILGAENVYPVFFDSDEIMKKIYQAKYHCSFDYKGGNDTVVQNMKAFSAFVSQLNCNYLVLTSAFPAQQAVARQYFPLLIENTQTQGVNFKLLAKKIPPRFSEAPEDEVLAMTSLTKPGDFKYSQSPDSITTKNLASEFPFSALADYVKVIKEEGNVALLSARLKINPAEAANIETCISVNHKTSEHNLAYTARPASDFVIKADSTVTIFADYFAGSDFNHIRHVSTISCYPWNRGESGIKVLDFELRIISYWQQKWHFWD